MAELFSAAETLALTREQIGDRLAILTNGAARVLATDALMAPGGHLATHCRKRRSAHRIGCSRRAGAAAIQWIFSATRRGSATPIRSLC